MSKKEVNKKTAKKETKKAAKKKRKMTPFSKLICFIFLGVSAYLLFLVGQEVYTTITLKQQLEEVQAKYQEVLDENSQLTSEKEKLEDPDYVANYARGTYLLSKDDEQVFYLPEDENK